MLKSTLFATLIGSSLVAHAATASIDDLSKTINELKEQVDELRAQSTLNIFTFSGDLSTRFDDLNVNQVNSLTMITPSNPSYVVPTGGTSPHALGADSSIYSGLGLNPSFQDVTNYYRLRTDLNFGANISNNTKFYSRMTATKFMNRFQQEGAPSTLTSDIHGPSSYLSDQMWLSRAYVDWNVSSRATISLGRLPTTDGPPANFPDGRARMGTYPMISYNQYLDGFAFTYKFDSFLPENNKLALRLVYTPFSDLNFGGSITGGSYYRNPWNGSGGGGTGSMDATTMDAYAIQLDYNMDEAKFADHMNAILQYLQTGAFHMNNTAPTANATNGDPTDANFSLSEISAMLEIDGLFSTPLDVSLSYLYTSVNTHGTIYAGVPVTGAAGGAPISTTYVPVGGFGCSPNAVTGIGCDKQIYGGNFLLSVRYKVKNYGFAGFEFEEADNGNFFYSGGAEDLTQLYGTVGNMVHGYWTQLFTPTMSLRAGISYQNINGSGMNFSQSPIAYTAYITTTYANFRVDF